MIGPFQRERAARTSARRNAVRRMCAVFAVAGLASACNAADEGADSAPLTTPTSNPIGTTPPAPSTAAPSSTAPVATPAPSAPTTPATTTATTPTTTPTTLSNVTTTPAPAPAPAPALVIPEPVRGTWRESEAASVGFDDCRQELGFEQNFGKVLTIDAASFTVFEAGGTLRAIVEQDESRVDATFDTIDADTTRQQRLVFDAQDGGSVLIVRDDRPGPTRYVRCPAAPTERPQDTPFTLEPVTADTVVDAGLEAIGCWMRPGQATDLAAVFFLSGDAAVLVIDGERVVLPESTTKQDTVIPDVTVGLTVSGKGYAATFAAVGRERPASIESSDRDVTLAVATPDGRRTYLDGILTCGV